MTSGSAAPSHDWSRLLDEEHLRAVRADPLRWAPDGALHLLAEVLAHADDEAALTGARRCAVTLGADGSVVVADSGRGTDTRVGPGSARRKPVMSTKDLRFFDADPPCLLPTGRARRGMSVVAALSSRLVHVNRRLSGSWSQVYAFGVPVTDLLPVAADGSTGTTVEFLPVAALPALPTGGGVAAMLRLWPHLDVELADDRREA